MKAFYCLILCLSLMLFTNCTTKEVKGKNDQQISKTETIESIAINFFQTYAERKDWDKLLSFYSNEMTFEDIILQMKLDSFSQFKNFYNWPDPRFKKLNDDQKHMVVETLAVNDSMAVARGHFNPFYWHGELIEPSWGMDFTIWLYFDENNEIKKQIDWIEYDLPVIENMVKRIKEKGLDSLPPGM